MEFEWNEEKAKTNLSKHGVSFEESQTVFTDPFYIDFFDPDHSTTENRFIIIGQSLEGKLLFVSYTERNNAIRIISSRLATHSERQFYEEGI